MIVDFRLRKITELLLQNYAAQQNMSSAVAYLVGNTANEQRDFMAWYIENAKEIAAAAKEIDEHYGALVLNYNVIDAVVASELSFKEKFIFFVRGRQSALGGYFCWSEGFFGEAVEITSFVVQLRKLSNSQLVWLLCSLLLSGNQYALELPYLVREIDWGPLAGIVQTSWYAIDDSLFDHAVDYYRELVAFALQNNILSLEPLNE